jgi:hypothetical protein
MKQEASPSKHGIPYLRQVTAFSVGLLLAIACSAYLAWPEQAGVSNQRSFQGGSYRASRDVLSPSFADESGKQHHIVHALQEGQGKKAAALERIVKTHARKELGEDSNRAIAQKTAKALSATHALQLSRKEKQREMLAIRRDIHQDEIAVQKAREEVQRYNILSFGTRAKAHAAHVLHHAAGPNKASGAVQMKPVVVASSTSSVHNDAEKADEIKAAKQEMDRYAQEGGAGIDKYVHDTQSEQHNIKGTRQVHLHGHETSKQLLKRYSRLAQAGIPNKKTVDVTVTKGELVTALSDSGYWRPATILQTRYDGHVLVHFNGFEHKYDEWLPAHAKRIRWSADAGQAKEEAKQLPAGNIPHAGTQDSSASKNVASEEPQRADPLKEKVHLLAVQMQQRQKLQEANLPHPDGVTAANSTQEEHKTTQAQLHKDAAGLPGMCERCLIDRSVPLDGRKNACGICLADRSMLAVSCGVCMDVSTPKSLFAMPFDSVPGSEYVLGESVCRDPCSQCRLCSEWHCMHVYVHARVRFSLL